MTLPVPLTLDLWATGMSSQRIAEMLAGSRGTVNRIVSQAREIGDPRAVVHVTAVNHKPAGNGRKAKELLAKMPHLEVVKLADKPCRRGHAMDADNILHVAGRRRCKACHRMREAGYRKARSTEGNANA